MKKGKKTVFITGATGVMGYQTLLEFCKYPDEFDLRLLVRPGRKNYKKLKPFAGRDNVTVIYGNLLDKDSVRKAMGDAEYVLHMGGLVSPKADRMPEKTMKVNVGSVNILVDIIKERPDHDRVHLVYIGSVAQTSCRHEPHHWGRTGDPILSSPYDYYGVSKILAERCVAESGLKYWVSLRQSGILHKGLIFNGSDPISFHVPLNGVLEWTTVEDSARLMVGVCSDSVPENFWCRFYNIGSGREFRLTNYEFECHILKALHCPPPEKVFEPGWFATRNFHGQWFLDSDKLNYIIPFREEISVEGYFERMVSELPRWLSLTPVVPAFIIKAAMKQIAHTKDYGTLNWLSRTDKEQYIKAYFGSREKQKSIPGWSDFKIYRPSDKGVTIPHGYDETKPEDELDLDDMHRVASFRGGKCLSATMTKGDLKTPLEWECAFGHRFKASPLLILKGGHWCEKCLPSPWQYDKEAKVNPFLAQIWYDSHDMKEDEVYQ